MTYFFKIISLLFSPLLPSPLATCVPVHISTDPHLGLGPLTIWAGKADSYGDHIGLFAASSARTEANAVEGGAGVAGRAIGKCFCRYGRLGQSGLGQHNVINLHRLSLMCPPTGWYIAGGLEAN